MTQPTVLVTGGAGFIGSHLVDALLASGRYRVKVLDSFATGNRDNIRHCRAAIDLVEGDIRDVETVEEAVAGVWAILHEAALPSVPRSIKAPVTTSDVNIGGTLKLLSAAKRAGVKRVVFASSSSIYGESETLPKHEGMAPSPLSPYAVTKHCGEQYFKVFHELYGLETVALRYFNVFGPRQDPGSQYSGVISKFITAASAGLPCTVNGDGTQTRDFSYIDNVVSANLLALQCAELDGKAVNIACGRRISLNDMVRTLGDILGAPVAVLPGDTRPGDVQHSQASIDAARSLLGYAPVVDFEEGLARTVAWYAAQAGPAAGASAADGPMAGGPA